jgi:NAD(P)-dependent dehydrogenase (short-subunit alcohol dehydrogenase family)
MNPAVLITGSARRLGRHTALHLARAGYDLALHYHSSQEDVQKLQAEIEALGQRAVVLQGDLMQRDTLPALVAQAKEALPHLGVLINNASVFEPVSFADTSPEQFDLNFGLHVQAPFFLSQAFAQYCKQGVIINFLDSFIRRQSDSYFTYLLSKKTLAALTQSLAHALAPDIRVNAVAPGVILPNGPFDAAYMEKRAAGRAAADGNAVADRPCAVD